MGFRKKLVALLNRSPRGGTSERTEPALPPRPESYLGQRPPTTALSTLQRRKPDDDAMWEIPSASGRRFPVPSEDESNTDPTASHKDKPNWRLDLEATAGVAIDLLKESSDAFGPLKSVAGGLSAILKHYEQTMANRETIQALIPRIEHLAESLSTPAPEGETEEIKRRQKLKEKLVKALRDLEPLAERGKIAGFVNNVKDADVMTGLADDIRDAMMDYQTALQQDIYHKSFQLIDSADLSLLKSMHHTPGAGFLARDKGGCLRGTRRDILLQIEQWLTNAKDERIFWLNGLAGTGKSTIAQTFAEISFADGTLGASFFCSRDFEDRNNLREIFPTLAFQLAHRYPQFREQLVQVLKFNHDVERESLSSQLEKVIIRPFKQTQIPALIIIDALDECNDREPASALLSVLSRQVHEIPNVKFFITGRPEPPIREGFRLKSLRPITDVLKLHDVQRSLVDEDIKLYLRIRLTDIRQTRSDCEFPEEWPTPYHINSLCEEASGLFISASTVVKFVASKYHYPTERLDLIISRSRDATHNGVDILYTQILQLAFEDADPDEQELYSRFRSAVGAVLLVFHPLSRKALSNLLTNCGTPFHISTTLRFVHSVLNVPDDEDEPIRVFHKSFPDFLTDRTRCKDDRFFVDPALQHEEILFSCLDLMKKHLKKNICGLDDYAVLSEVNDLSARRESCIGNSLEYACQFWTRHLASVPGDGPHVKRIQEVIEEFFEKRLLCWIEVLSIVGQLEAAVYAINNIKRWYISAGISSFDQADDSEHLILSYFDLIRDSPSHIYHSALPLSPSSSWVRKCYEAEVAVEVRVLMGLPDRWDTCSRTIPLSSSPQCFAYWEGIIAVGLGSSVVLLDAMTGTEISCLYEYPATGWVISLTFSLDGTLLVSTTQLAPTLLRHTQSGSVRLWDIQTGGLIRTFHNDIPLYSVSISPDGTTIASGADNGVILLWNVQTGNSHSIETSQDAPVTGITFSPIDSRRILSSTFYSLWQGGIDGRQIGTSQHEARNIEDSPYASNGTDLKPGDVAYALDGTRFVSCRGNIATVRDSESGAEVVELDSPDGLELRQCRFSPDGRFVACATDTIIWVWDITTPEAPLVGHLFGHSSTIVFIAFSSSIISGSWDQSVRLWNTGGFSVELLEADLTVERDGPTEIKSVNLYAEDGVVVTSNWCGMVKIWDLPTGRCKSFFQTPAKVVSDTRLAGDTLIIVWWADEEKTYNIWDVYKGQLLRRIYTSLPNIRGLKISGDGSMIFGLCGDHNTGWSCIDAQSVQTGESVGRVEIDFREDSALFVRGSKVGIDHSRGSGWDFGGPKVSDLEEFPDPPRLHLIYEPSRSIRVTKPLIEDTVTKSLVFRPPDRYMEFVGVEWDGRYLFIWSRARDDILIVDFNPVYGQLNSTSVL